MHSTDPPSLGRTQREYPEGQQNMEKQMKVKSFNPREGKLQQQKQTVFAKKLLTRFKF